MVHPFRHHRITSDDDCVGQTVLEGQAIGVQRITGGNKPAPIEAFDVEAPLLS